MDLMPHIKCLIDDLMSITENIVVKRQDIADKYDNELINMRLPRYYQAILEDNFTINTFTDIPIDILKSLCKWVRKDESFPVEYFSPNTLPVVQSNNHNSVWYSAINPNEYFQDRYNEVLTGDSYVYYKPNIYDMKNVTNKKVTQIYRELSITNNDCALVNPRIYLNIKNERINVEYTIPDDYNVVLLHIPTEYISYELLTTITRDNDDDEGLYSNEKFYFGKIEDDTFVPFDLSLYETYNDDNIVYVDISSSDGDKHLYVPINEVEYIVNLFAENIIENKTYATVTTTTGEQAIKNVKAGKISINKSIKEVNLYVKVEKIDNYIYYVGDEEIDINNYSLYVKNDNIYTKVDIPEKVISDNYYVYIPKYEYYVAEQALTTKQISDILSRDMALPESLIDQFLFKAKRYVINEYCPDMENVNYGVTIYRGEQNDYYRMLNGLPPINSTDLEPTINMKRINENYIDTNVYLYELSDHDVSIIKNNGILKEYLEEYPDKEYLKYLGESRIDCIVARNAEPFDILVTGKYNTQYHYDLFVKNYAKAKDYILIKYYFPELYKDQVHYLSFISFLMVTYAMNMCISESGTILTKSKYNDAETIELKLDSFGLNIFDNIPLIYRRNIAKNIEKLIRNKAIDSIYSIIYDVFNIQDIDIYKYYFYNKPDDNGGKTLEISRVPIDSEHIMNDMVKLENILDYDSVTTSDKYWGIYETDNAIKELIEAYNFNFAESKYIGINIIFNINKLIMSTSVLLNYLLESAELSSSVLLKPTFSENQHELKDLMIFLFAINAKLMGYDGNIPMDILQIATVYKYDLETELNLNNRYVKPLDLYKSFLNDSERDVMSKLTIEKVNSYNYDIDLIANKFISNSSDGGIYSKIKSAIESANSFGEYQCYRQLYNCVYKNNSMNRLFSLNNPIFEKIGNVVNNNIEWTYMDMDSIWVPVNSDYIFNTVDDNDNVVLGLYKDSSETYMVRYLNGEHVKAVIGYPPIQFNSLPKDVGAFIDTSNLHKPELSMENINEVTVYFKYDLKSLINDNINFGNDIIFDGYRITKGFGEPNSSKYIDTNDTVIYVEYKDLSYFDEEDKLISKYSPIAVYILTEKALTFKSWLKYNNNELYNLLEFENADNDYYNNLYLEIINTIESSISDDLLIRQLNLEYLDYDSISKYIKYVLEVFKSFTIDVASIDCVYSIDDKSSEAIRIFNMLPTFDYNRIISKINFLSTLNVSSSTTVLGDKNEKIGLNDELIII